MVMAGFYQVPAESVVSERRKAHRRAFFEVITFFNELLSLSDATPALLDAKIWAAPDPTCGGSFPDVSAVAR